MTAKPPDGNDDESGVTETISVSRLDESVRSQFVWEVGETLELIRTVSMAGSQIDGMSASDILTTCISNLVELGEALEQVGFVERVRSLSDVLLFDPFDGVLVDKHIDDVMKARWL